MKGYFGGFWTWVAHGKSELRWENVISEHTWPLSSATDGDAIDDTGCPKVFQGKCRCGNFTYDNWKAGEKVFMVNCTNAGFKNTEMLEQLPDNTQGKPNEPTHIGMVKKHTTLQFVINAKLSQQSVRHRHDTALSRLPMCELQVVLPLIWLKGYPGLMLIHSRGKPTFHIESEIVGIVSLSHDSTKTFAHGVCR